MKTITVNLLCGEHHGEKVRLDIPGGGQIIGHLEAFMHEYTEEREFGGRRRLVPSGIQLTIDGWDSTVRPSTEITLLEQS